MQEIKVKTHLIITDIHSEYNIKWCGRVMDVTPKLKDNQPVFIISGGKGRTEVITTRMKELERVAKIMTEPKGRGAVTVDTAYIFIKAIDGKEHLLGTVTHKKIKRYAPMYDAVGYKN